MIHNPNFIFYLIRHGQSEKNACYGTAGQTPDEKLTKLGESQAVKLGERFKKLNIKFDYIYSSTYLRAAETARITCEQFANEKQILLDERLREYSAGKWLGKNLEDTVFSDENIKRSSNLNMNFLFPGGESLSQVESRMVGWLNSEFLCNEEKLEKHSNKEVHIAVFSHGQAIKSLLHNIMGFDSSITMKLSVNNTSISQVQFTEYGWFIKFINDYSHLY